MRDAHANTADLRLSGIYIYPVKSCAEVVLDGAEVEHLGLAHDRRWMLVEAETGKFITGRECPELVLLHATITSDGALELSAFSPRVLALRTVSVSAQRRQVRVWGDDVIAAVADSDTNLALSNWLGRAVELVYFDARSQRVLDQKYAQSTDQTAFADGYPLMLIGQASLDVLNNKLTAPISMRRFRPNLVIAGDIAAHAEDSWQRVQIGSARFDVVKPCIRCIFTTVDPDLGARDPSGEPLSTLKNYRRTPNGISFGMNLIPRNPGVKIQVGDVLRVLA